MVVATQNPIEQQGTYPLPEAQLDRFLFKIADRLSRAATRSARSCAATATARPCRASTSSASQPVADADDAGEARRRRSTHIRCRDDARSTTSSTSCGRPASTRRSKSAPRRAPPTCWPPRRAPARRSQGRDFVIPDDVKALAAAGAAPPPHAVAGRRDRRADRRPDRRARSSTRCRRRDDPSDAAARLPLFAAGHSARVAGRCRRSSPACGRWPVAHLARCWCWPASTPCWRSPCRPRSTVTCRRRTLLYIGDSGASTRR